MSIHIDHTGAFASFWNREFPGVPCPPVPKKESDLTMTARETLRISDPKLFQNMFATSTASLPADVANRRNLGQNIASDADALQAAGLREADELRRKAGIAEMQRMNERIDESRQVQQQAAQRREEWQSMGILERMCHQPLSPEVIARNRREWGITGQ
tara:strand:- start:205 stop:678 length:474 start_codon:yes stop_codon:yes gene_type:complete